MGSDDLIKNIREKNMQKELQGIHYYGDRVRVLFLVISVSILIATPFFMDKLPLPATYSVLGVLILSVLAGLTNPRSKKVIIMDFVISLLLVIVFGYQTMDSYRGFYPDLFFLSNLTLGVLSVFALYFSSKTVRGGTLG